MTTPPPTLAAVLVCHRSWPTTASAARALAAAGLDPARIVVVDSASGDGSDHRLRRLLPASPVLAPATNDGFAAAANAGAACAFDEGATAVLFLNPDVVFAPDLPARLLAAASLATAALAPPLAPAILQPGRAGLQVGPDDASLEIAVAIAPVIRPLAGPGRPFAGAFTTPIPGRWRRRKPPRPSSPTAAPSGTAPSVPARVDILWATCLLVTRDAWRRTGPFDPGYFLYYEDIDWCDRARTAGVGLYVAGDAAVWHAGAHTTGGRDGVVRRRHMARSAVRYHRTRGAAPHRLRGVLVAAALARTAVGLAMRGRWGALAAHVRGVRDGCR